MEEELLTEFLEGNAQSAKKIYDIYSTRMYAICFSYTKNKNDAEDLLQDSFIKVFSKMHLYSNKGSLEGWIRRVIVNTALNYVKTKKQSHLPCDGLEDSVKNNYRTPLDILFEKDLHKITDELSSGYKTVFYLRAVEGYTHEEIAQKLGISCNTSKSQYCRARSILQKKIDCVAAN